ncbi:TPR superfamily protein, putative [Medicago truncatula]|uniref:TPR superfamily protein, putative n=1 Tax=Medicago truncatula TaxID=3880 RepID=A0A072UNW0_MEDTR|nr:TPR superfamily protein, putative [Medicago truncatula]
MYIAYVVLSKADGKHVIAAIKVCAHAEKVDGVNHMNLVMGSFVDKLTFNDMFVVLKDKADREQVRHLIL